MKTLLRTSLNCIILVSLLVSISGCSKVDEIVDVLNRGIDEFKPSKWQSALGDILSDLDKVGGNLAKKVSNEISALMEDARIQSEILLGFAENQSFCTYDFVGSRVELRLKMIANNFFPETFPKPVYTPAICNVVDDTITVGVESIVRYFGFDFINFEGYYKVQIIEEGTGNVVNPSVADFAPVHNYECQVHIIPRDTNTLDPQKKYKLVVFWNDIALDMAPNSANKQSRISIVWPKPTPDIPETLIEVPRARIVFTQLKIHSNEEAHGPTPVGLYIYRVRSSGEKELLYQWNAGGVWVDDGDDYKSLFEGGQGVNSVEIFFQTTIIAELYSGGDCGEWPSSACKGRNNFNSLGQSQLDFDPEDVGPFAFNNSVTDQGNLGFELLVTVEPLPPYPPSEMEWDTNRNLSDLPGSPIDLQTEDPRICIKLCEENPMCQAWTYVRPQWQGVPRCYLKSPAPDPVNDRCCISGVKK